MAPDHSQDDSSPDPTRVTRKISFDCVEIREYNRILSDNPATTNGPPVGLGWNYSPDDTLRIDLETYESSQCNARRSMRQLAIPSQVRQEMLLEEGYSRGEIARTVREIRKIREQRNVSFHHIKYDPIAEKVEALKRGVKGIIPGKRILPGMMKSKKLESPSLLQFSSKGA